MSGTWQSNARIWTWNSDSVPIWVLLGIDIGCIPGPEPVTSLNKSYVKEIEYSLLQSKAYKEKDESWHIKSLMTELGVIS